MISLYTDDRMIEHHPPRSHPERPERLQAILRHLDRSGLRACLKSRPVREATRAELGRVHTTVYLDRVSTFEVKGGGLFEADTWIYPGSNEAARLAAGAVVGAVEQVAKGEDRRALCLVRPPGHHARPHDAMGFCIYGSISVGAAHAVRALDMDRVLIVDFDVHHGNGTQEIFYDDSRVAFYSIHRYPFYPGSGRHDETGTGKGLGWTRNVPIAMGTSRADYLSAFRSSVETFADKAKPSLVMLSAGFDAHADDPVGDLGLEVEDFVEITKILAEVADAHCGGRIVSVLEGGYNVPILAGCVGAHVEALMDETTRKAP